MQICFVDVVINKIWGCFGEVEGDGESRKPRRKQSRRQLQETFRAFNNLELNPSTGSRESEQSHKRPLRSKTSSAPTKSMVQLLNTFNNSRAASTQKGAMLSEQPLRNRTEAAGPPTTATSTAASTAWKTGGGEKVGDCSDLAERGKKGINPGRGKGERNYIYPYLGRSSKHGNRIDCRHRYNSEEEHRQGSLHIELQTLFSKHGNRIDCRHRYNGEEEHRKGSLHIELQTWFSLRRRNLLPA
jgi:hypothetical protein